MSFLAPLFLIGGALIAGPIIAHLIRRATRERVPFTATEFLDPSPPRLRRRSRIEHWWLLLLRCLAVMILAFGFSRPFFQNAVTPPPPPAVPRHVVAVLDDSASMQRRGLWAAAVQRVRAAANDVGPGDRFALIAAGAELTTLISGEQWARTPPNEREALVAEALSAHNPGWGPTRLDTAVEAALEELGAMAEGGEGLAAGKIVVVSDFTAGARIAGLAGRDWPPGCVMDIARVEPAKEPNASLQWLGWTTLPDGKRAARLRAGQDGESVLALRLQLRDAATRADIGEPQIITLAPREARVVLLDVPDTMRAPLQVTLDGDGEPFDNTVWLVPPQPRDLTLPYLGRYEANDPKRSHFYVTRATEGWRDPKVRVLAVDPGDAASPSAAEAPLFVVAEALPGPAAAALRARLERGAFALMLLSDESMIATAAALAGETGWTAAPVTRNNALLGQIDFQHPLFAPFADPRFSDFTRVHFWHPVPVALPDGSPTAVAARFDDGSPAVLETEVGEGRLVVWGGDWSSAASQWVLSTKFVPWLQALVERATGGPPRPNVAEIGNLTALAGTTDAQWRKHQATPGTFAADSPEIPGIYEVKEGDRTRWVALQVPVVESRTEPLPLDTWENLGVPLADAPLTTATTPRENLTAASAATLESRQQLWRWLLIGAIMILAVESLAATALAQRAAGKPEETAGGLSPS